MTDESVEQEIQRKGLTAARITPQHVEDVISEEVYIVPAQAVHDRGAQVASNSPLRLLTICILVLKNGFTVTGESACASAANFDEALGRRIARDNAKQKIWALEGYLLREKLHARAIETADFKEGRD
jgi:hypothetical protein